MNNSELAELVAFSVVAKHLSFRQAATERGTSASAVSHSVRNLEARVGVRLFHRSTRSVSLTEAGQMLHARVAPALADIQAAVDELNAFRATPFGTVRINVPSTNVAFVLGEAVEQLLKNNPGLQLQVVATDSLVDIVEKGFDAGIRFGERLSQDMIAVRIKPRPRVAVVGSPGYFSGKRVPLTPHDLQGHTCIRYMFPSGAVFDWEFVKDGATIRVAVMGPLMVDNQDLMLDAAVRGLGLAYAWEDSVAPYLRDGRLRRCLEDWTALDESLFLYFPSRRHQSAGLRALIEVLKA